MTSKSKKYRLAIIGAGNMGSAILNGVIDSGFLKACEISVYDKDSSKTEKFAHIKEIHIFETIEEPLLESEYVLLAVKPQQIKDVLEFLKYLYPRTRNVILSIAAGLGTKFFENYIGEKPSVIRIMPNTPSIYRKGMAVISKGSFAEEEHLRFAEGLMKSVGEAIKIDEKMQNIATVISGSGPAYFYTFCKHITDFAVKKGFDEKTARKLVTETMSGTAMVLKKSNLSFDSLINAVASPGGTTEQALEVFKEEELPRIFDHALGNALKRADELGKTIS